MKKLKKFLITTVLSTIFLTVLTIPYWSVENHKVNVTKTLVKNEKNLVYTTKTTFQIADSWHYLRFNSADVFGSIQEGQEYNIKTYGFRFGLFSWFPNIISAEKVK